MVIDYIYSSIREQCPVCNEDLTCFIYIDDDWTPGRISPIRDLPHVLQFDPKLQIFKANTYAVGFPVTIDIIKGLPATTDQTKISFRFSCLPLAKNLHGNHNYFNRSQYVQLNGKPFNFNTVTWTKEWERLEISIEGYDKFIFGIERNPTKSTSSIEHKDYKVFKNTKQYLPLGLNLNKLSFDNKTILLEKLNKYFILK